MRFRVRDFFALPVRFLEVTLDWIPGMKQVLHLMTLPIILCFWGYALALVSYAVFVKPYEEDRSKPLTQDRYQAVLHYSQMYLNHASEQKEREHNVDLLLDSLNVKLPQLAERNTGYSERLTRPINDICFYGREMNRSYTFNVASYLRTLPEFAPQKDPNKDREIKVEAQLMAARVTQYLITISQGVEQFSPELVRQFPWLQDTLRLTADLPAQKVNYLRAGRVFDEACTYDMDRQLNMVHKALDPSTYLKGNSTQQLLDAATQLK